MAEAQEAEKLYTLTEVSKQTNISMPTLQRYKKLFQDRIPSVGAGRSQRYPEEALDVFLDLKKENIGKRGRPRKNASGAATAEKAAKKPTASKRGRKKAAAPKTEEAAQSDDSLLTLTQISKKTKISYPTLLRYVRTHLSEIPHKGSGRGRRFLPEAVEVFQNLRDQSKRGRKAGGAAKKAEGAAKSGTGRRRGRPPAAAAASAAAGSVDAASLLDRIKELEKSQKQLERLIAKQQKQLEKPFRVTLQR